MASPWNAHIIAEKEEKFFWNRNFSVPEDLNDIPRHIGNLSLRARNWPVYDDALMYIARRIKTIEQLDLDLTDITNEGIKHLTRLECLKELRLKDCCYLDNDCVESLLQINGLELLHLGGTNINIDGLTQIHTITTLKLLLISVHPRGDKETEDKLETMAINLPPGCRFLVNHKDYEFR